MNPVKEEKAFITEKPMPKRGKLIITICLILFANGFLLSFLLPHSIQLGLAREIVYNPTTKNSGTFSTDAILQPGDTLTVQIYGYWDSPPQVTVEIQSTSPVFVITRTYSLSVDDDNYDEEIPYDDSNYDNCCLTITNDFQVAGKFFVTVTPSNSQEYTVKVIRNAGDWRFLYAPIGFGCLVLLILYLGTGIQRYRRKYPAGNRINNVLLFSARSKLEQVQYGLILMSLGLWVTFPLGVYISMNLLFNDPIRMAQIEGDLLMGATIAGIGLGLIFLILGILILRKKRTMRQISSRSHIY